MPVQAYVVKYYWTSPGGGVSATRTMPVRAYTAADAITQATVQLQRHDHPPTVLHIVSVGPDESEQPE